MKPAIQRPTQQHSGFIAALRRSWERSLGSVSLFIVAACVVLFLGVTLADLLHIFSRQKSTYFLGLSFNAIYHNHWYHQFITAPFLHGSIAHLLFNALALWMLGPGVEKTLGRRRYLFFSALCAGCSMIVFLAVSWGKGNVFLGYSAIIFGILVAQAIFFPDSIISLFAFFPLKMKHAVLLLGAVELYLTISQEGHYAVHAAHLCGALAAFFYLRSSQWWSAFKTRKKVRSDRQTIPKPISRKSRRDIPREL
jgi:membrane associated rhomboid family serine protease